MFTVASAGSGVGCAAAQVMKAGAAAVEADWPLELAQLSFPDLGLATVEGGHKDGEALALGGGHASISISSAPASADDLDWLLDASGATALMLLEVRSPTCPPRTDSAIICCKPCMHSEA